MARHGCSDLSYAEAISMTVNALIHCQHGKRMGTVAREHWRIVRRWMPTCSEASRLMDDANRAMRTPLTRLAAEATS